jgi:hypothetical protein
MTVSRFSILSFAALVLTAIALIPAGAHVIEMAAKMKLGRDAYFVVQGLYRGWAYFGIAIVGSLLATLANAALPGARRDRLLSLFAGGPARRPARPAPIALRGDHDRRLAGDLFRLCLPSEPDHAKLDRDSRQLEELALSVGVGARRVRGLYVPCIPRLGVAGRNEKAKLRADMP